MKRVKSEIKKVEYIDRYQQSERLELGKVKLGQVRLGNHHPHNHHHDNSLVPSVSMHSVLRVRNKGPALGRRMRADDIMKFLESFCSPIWRVQVKSHCMSMCLKHWYQNSCTLGWVDFYFDENFHKSWSNAQVLILVPKT